MSLPDETRNAIAEEIEEKFEFLFKQLNNANNKGLVDKFIPLKRVILRKRKETQEVVHDGEGAD